MVRAFVAAALSGLAFVAAPATAANLLTNGDFESGTSGYYFLPGVPAFTDIAVLQGSDYIPCCGASGTPAQLANHFATFGAGDQPNLSTLVFNPINTVAGQVYSLTFDFGAIGGGSTPQTLTYGGFGTGLNFTPATVTDSTATSALGSVFQTYTASFTGTGSPVSVYFTLAGSGTASVDGVLDNVAVAAAVPEPASWALLIGGFGAVGGMVRRRRPEGARATA